MTKSKNLKLFLQKPYETRTPNERWAILIAYTRQTQSISRTQFSQRLEVSNSTITYWENAWVFPHHKNVYELAKMNNKTIDETMAYLQGESDWELFKGGQQLYLVEQDQLIESSPAKTISTQQKHVEQETLLTELKRKAAFLSAEEIHELIRELGGWYFIKKISV